MFQVSMNVLVKTAEKFAEKVKTTKFAKLPNMFAVFFFKYTVSFV